LLYKAAVFAYRQKRRLAWTLDGRKFAGVFQKEGKLPHNVKRHPSREIKRTYQGIFSGNPGCHGYAHTVWKCGGEIRELRTGNHI
jgi:hypothetical protein